MTRWYLSMLFACAAGMYVMAAEPPGDAERTTVLDVRSYYRWHLTYQPEQFRGESGELLERSRRKVTWGKRKKEGKELEVLRTSWPEAGWTGADFDDRRWVRCRGPLIERTVTILGNDAGVANPCVRLLCMRGKFVVSDPAAVKDLKLSLAYRGGVVVRMNGKEVARGHMPKDELRNDTPATDYPDNVYVTKEGILLPSGTRTAQYQSFELRKRELLKAFKKAKIDAAHLDQCAQRVRTLENISVPTDVLRKGVNVLTIEVHRAPTAHIFYTAERRESGGVDFTWPMIQVEALTLTAGKQDPIEGNVSPPAGTQVWVQPLMRPVFALDYGDRFGELSAIELAGARNGSFSGQLVIASQDGIKTIEVRPTDLASERGKGSIPASSIRVLYGLPDGEGHPSSTKRYFEKPSRYVNVVRFDTLDEEPGATPKDGRTIQPVWITVRVPSDAAPGRYTGKVVVKANGTETEVPLGIEVADYVLPDPKAFTPFIGLVQSPRTLSIKYDAPMWSDAHWALIDQSLKLLGEVGTSVIYVPVICNTHHGNGEYTMIHWIRGKDGTYTHDFGIFEKYLDTALKRLGTDIVVVLYVYDPVKAYGKADECIPLKVRVRDTDGGELTEMDAPAWESEESGAFWKPVFAGVKERMAARGITGEPAIGTAGQGMPKPAIPVLNSAVPDSRWIIYCHYVKRDVGGKPARVTGTVMQWPGDMSYLPLDRYYGWQDDTSTVVYFPRRFPLQLAEETPLAVYHMFIEALLACNFRGIGWCGADFWRVKKTARKGRFANILLKNWNQLSLGSGNVGWTIGPGSRGPVPTVRHEMLREGIQEAECRILMERALTDTSKRAVLGETLAAECEALLDARVRAMTLATGTHRNGKLFAKESEQDMLWYAATAPERSRKLFKMAGRVARALGTQPESQDDTKGGGL